MAEVRHVQTIPDEAVLQVFKIMKRKSNAMEPIPLRALKEIYGELINFITDVIKQSSSTGVFQV